ncbi:MAG: hypothetical protein JNN07_24005 [Verrucomicrobiales bacterium]|nr:hypothetical protein [Verrucomicrobiales bacterium]
MDDTAFDALCEGASPAEAKQLRKLLAAWCQGDENSFPVQLVLLNRSQFRAAAKVLLTIEASRASLQKEFREQQNCIASQIKAYESTTLARTQELQKQIRDQAAIAEKILGSFKSHLVEAEKTAQQIRDGLVKGSKAWDAAKADFDQSGRILRQECADLQSSPWLSHWVLVVALWISAGFLGYFWRRMGG